MIKKSRSRGTAHPAGIPQGWRGSLAEFRRHVAALKAAGRLCASPECWRKTHSYRSRHCSECRAKHDDEMTGLYLQGVPAKRIAERFECQPNRVYAVLKARGIPTRRAGDPTPDGHRRSTKAAAANRAERAQTRPERAQAIELRRQGLPLDAIAEALGGVVCAETVGAWCRADIPDVHEAVSRTNHLNRLARARPDTARSASIEALRAGSVKGHETQSRRAAAERARLAPDVLALHRAGWAKRRIAAFFKCSLPHIDRILEEAVAPASTSLREKWRNSQQKGRKTRQPVEVRAGDSRYCMEAIIAAAMTPRGGFTRKTLAAWGVDWPPRKGWRRALVQSCACGGQCTRSARQRAEGTDES